MFAKAHNTSKLTGLTRLIGLATLAVILFGMALASASAQAGPASTQGVAPSVSAPGVLLAPPAAPAAPVAACSPFGYARATRFGVGNNPAAVAVGDFNHDGNPDLAVANYLDDNVSVLLGTGADGLGTAVNYDVGINRRPAAVAVGDFNQDGHPDIAVGLDYSTVPSVIILLGNGTGGFPTTSGAVGVGHVASIAVGDFNHDGKPDIATADQAANAVSVRLNNGAGGFTTYTSYGVGNLPMSVAVGDFNQDGNPDLATANYYSNNVSVLLGNGAGSFGAAVYYAVGTNPISVAVGDFNRDGNPDLAAANYGSSNVASNDVSVLLGNGAGSFGVATNFAASTLPFPKSVAVGDFNRDGNPDLVTANSGSQDVSVLLGDGAGSFGVATNFWAVGPGGTPPRPNAVAVGDFNRDGNPDLITANYNTRNVSVLLNTCASLTPTVTPTTPTNTVTPTPTNTPTSTAVAPTSTPTATSIPPALLVAHLTWQGRPTPPNMLNQLPLTLTLQLGAGTTTFTNLLTNARGTVTVSVGTLPLGVYTWWVKGDHWLATAGTVTLTGTAITPAELGQQWAGDVNNDNLVDIADFSLLRASFGKACGDGGYDGRADFTGDCLVDISDFSLLRGNFGLVGAPAP